MFYNFIYDCDPDLLNSIEKTLGNTNYFLVGIGYINFFYTDSNDKYYKLRSILIDRRILIHTAAPKDMRMLVKSADAGVIHLNGDLSLYKSFVDDSGFPHKSR